MRLRGTPTRHVRVGIDAERQRGAPGRLGDAQVAAALRGAQEEEMRDACGKQDAGFSKGSRPSAAKWGQQSGKAVRGDSAS